MSRLLVIEASPRGAYSVSRRLAERFADAWHGKHSGEVVVRDLAASDAPYISLPWIGGAFTPSETDSLDMTAAIKISDDYIAELLAADDIVIDQPPGISHQKLCCHGLLAQRGVVLDPS